MHHSSLDTSNGAAFVQQRLTLFAKVLTLISAAFFLINVGIGLWFDFPVRELVGHRPAIANISGLSLLAVAWFIGRRKQLTLPQLNILDITSLLGPCIAWALFLDDRHTESIFSAVTSVSMTILARAIIVPSKLSRTARLSFLATLPVLGIMWTWLGSRIFERTTTFDIYTPGLIVVNQTLLLVVVVALAKVSSRILYDLRRSVKEANELGQYLLEEKLGAGGMGEVWRARHRLLVRAAAVKLIRPELLAGTNASPDVVLRRFEREALATAALRSPHTVHLYDFGQAEDGTLFYVMELLQGIDLEKLVARFGPVPPERVIHILTQVCHSLDEAHQNGLTHRDIKPANIFVSGTGTDSDFVKVLDFGLVRLRPADTRNPLHTNEESVGGTPAYVAPEIVLGEQAYDHRVDIYAVGCVAYWLLSGQLVFNSGSAMAMLADHARTAAPRLSLRTELPVPDALEQLIMACLEKDPARRPASARELARRLAECNVGERWTPARAEQWWKSHLPESGEERPVADVLLSHEGSPVKALRPRRPVSVSE
jgi:eukaryotic-like serine/threonine-protein kinase